jgi:multidrug efflux system outer membrane protein
MKRKQAIPRGIALLGILAATVTGCTTGPDFIRPEIAIQERFESATPAQAGLAAMARDWWTLYHDDTLSGLIEAALAANQSIQAAIARVAQARATAAGTRGDFYPSANLGASYSRAQSAERAQDGTSTVQDATTAINQANDALSRLDALRNGDLLTALGGLNSGQEAESATGGVSTSYRLPFDLSYEIDFWGRVRRASEAAGARATASEYELETVRQTVAADVAQNYFNLRALDEKERILVATLAAYEEQVSLTQWRRDAGLTGEGDLLQSRIQRENATVEHSETQRQRANAEHALAILVGRAPGTFVLAPRAMPIEIPEIPAGIPGALLRQRPDVAEAEQGLIAANAEIGAAMAERYPKFTITGSAGMENTASNQLLDAPSLFWSLAPGVSLPLFQGGKLKANIRGAEARYDEQVALYREAVLNAYVDAETALTDINRRAEQGAVRDAVAADARELARLTRLEYDSGMTDYLSVLSAEQTLLSSEIAVVSNNQDRLSASVLLIKALGGGWDDAGTH